MQFIEDGELSIAIDLDQGARITSLLFRDMEITLASRGSLVNWGWYSMAPWAGRIRHGVIKDRDERTFQLPVVLDPPHALHGFGVMHGWEDLGKGVARLDLPYPYEGASVLQQIEVLDNAIRWSLEYSSGDVTLPAWLGIHPWFAREIGQGSSAEIDFNALEMLERGSDGLPTGEIIPPHQGPFDDAFTKVQGIPRVIWQDALSLTIESDAPWWVVYNEDSEGVCIEPQTAPPDAANLANQGLVDGLIGDQYLEALFVFEAE